MSAGDGATTITVSGQNLDAVSEVFVHDQATGWTSIRAVTNSPQSAKFELPVGLRARPGFLQVAPLEVLDASLALIVSDPSLPSIGTAQGFTLEGTDRQELGPGGGAIAATGAGFEEGMRLVLGRGTGGVALPTDFLEDGRLVAEVPSTLGRAEDLFIAVLGVGNSGMSGAIAAKSTLQREIVDFSSILPPGGRTITSIGPLFWNQPAQAVEIEGIGLEPGMLFQISASPATTVAAQASAQTPAAVTSPPSTRVRITIPDRYTRWPNYYISIEPSDPSVARMRPQRVGAQPAVFLPVGGRKKFIAVKNPGLDNRVYILPQDDPAAGRTAGCAKTQPGSSLPATRMRHGQRFVVVPPPEMAFTFSNPTIPHPFSSGSFALPRLPLVAREISKCDPDYSGNLAQPNVFYLRGIRSAVGTETLTVTATQLGAGGTLEGQAEVKVLVAEGDLGRARGGADIEAAISAVAAQTGVPPQFLKAQAEKETNFTPDRVKYESASIDLERINMEGAPWKTSLSPYLERHLRAGATVGPVDASVCVVIQGPGAQPVPTTTAGCAPVPGQPPMNLNPPGTGLIRGRVGRPGGASSAYHGGQPTATRYTPNVAPAPPTALDLDLREQPWRSFSQQNLQPQPPSSPIGPSEFQIDYSDNTLRLGQPLAPNQWLVVRYRMLQQGQLQPGACNLPDATGQLPFDVTSMTGKNPPNIGRALQFAVNDTIGTWLGNNARSGYNFLDDQTGNTHIEFGLNPPNTTARDWRVRVDRRLDLATAQFVAASSFGITQFTLIPWVDGGPNQVGVLNQAFNLDDHCLYELMPDPSHPTIPRSIRQAAQNSLRLSAALHSYHMTATTALTQPADQEEWARYWSQVFKRYNASGDEYCSDPTKPSGKPCTGLVNGLSRLIQLGITQYDPSAQGCNQEFGTCP